MAYFIDFKSNDYPDSLQRKFGVKAENKKELEKVLSDKTSLEVRILQIDSLDVDNHKDNAHITIDGYTYYADIEEFEIIND